LKIDNVSYFEASNNLNSLALKQAKPQPRNEIEDCFSLDFTTQGTPAGALITNKINDFRLKPDMSAAGTVNLTVEYWGPLGSA
jgi:hypothetical protein